MIAQFRTIPRAAWILFAGTFVTRFGTFVMPMLAVYLGFAAGPAMAGFLADRSFFYVFLGDAGTSIGYGIIALAALPNLRGGAPPDAARGRVGRPTPAFLLFFAATLCLTLVDFQMGSTFALHVKSLGFPTSAYGML